MPKFRKRPVVVEAVRWTGKNVGEIRKFMEPNYPRIPKLPGEVEKPFLIIHTLEGDHKAKVGDWVIKGVKGEFYPCKPDIFAKTYELVEAKDV